MRNYYRMYLALTFILMATQPIIHGASENVVPRFLVNQFLKEGPVRKLAVEKLTWENCGSSNDLGRLYRLNFHSTTHSDFAFGFKIANVVDLNGPLKIALDVKLKTFGTYVKLPCTKKIIGSCTFSDFCKVLNSFPACPFKSLRDAKIPCRCPFPKGTYEVKNGLMPNPTTKYADSLAGDYSITAKLSYGGGYHLACYRFNVTLA